MKKLHSDSLLEQCEYCHKTFRNLFSHLKSVHEGVMPFKCKFCEKCFSQSSNMKSHILAIHQEVKQYECDICEHKFSLKSQITNHMNKKHVVIENIKIYNCPKCELRFKEHHQLRSHILVKFMIGLADSNVTLVAKITVGKMHYFSIIKMFMKIRNFFHVTFVPRI